MPKEDIRDGDRVQVVDREADSADIKSQLYYNHYRGMVGTLTKRYADDTANVNVDLDSLSSEVRKRHEEGTTALRQKWLDGMSEEARNRLSAAEKKFRLSYSIIVSVKDLLKLEPGETPKAIGAAPQAALDIPIPPRKSLSDLEEAERRHLEEVARKKNG